MREQLLRGTISLPSYDSFVTKIGRYYASLADAMFRAMWQAYLKDKGTVNGIYWCDRFANAQVYNLVILSLSKAGWITSDAIPERNWAEARINESKLLQYCTLNELEDIRAHKKFAHYRLTDDVSTKTVATRLNGKVKNTGLAREGFAAAGNTRFTYDQAYMLEYREVVQANLTKSMDKIAEMYPQMRHDRASYDTISCELLDFYLVTNDSFTRGDNYNDSRGRAISSSLAKVGNPISCKDFRALLVMPTM